MRALFSQFSGLIGLLAFVNQMLASAPVEKALLVGTVSGLAVYVVLLLGDVVIQRVLDQASNAVSPQQATPSVPAEPPQAKGAGETVDADAKAA